MPDLCTVIKIFIILIIIFRQSLNIYLRVRIYVMVTNIFSKKKQSYGWLFSQRELTSNEWIIDLFMEIKIPFILFIILYLISCNG